jgi:hypothetical protein
MFHDLSFEIPWLRQVVAALSSQMPRFMPGSVRAGFVVDRVTLEQVFLQVFLVFLC